jgi:hypothetical protein
MSDSYLRVTIAGRERIDWRIFFWIFSASRKNAPIAVTRCFSRCLIFRCFWIKPKRKKNLREEKFLDRCFGKRPDPSIRRFLFAA